MKNDYVWARTILSVYRYLERIAGAIDKIIMQKALSSANICGQNYYQNNVYTLSQNLIDLSERKVTLINLKILTENTLSKIDKDDANILIEKFFDGVKSKDIASRHEFSMRTVFRRIDSAVQKFAKTLSMQGYGDLALQNMLKDENWILCVYNRLATNVDEDFTLSGIFLKKAVSM